MSTKFEKTRALRISKLWRDAKKEDPAKEIEKKGVRKFGKQKTQNLGKGVRQCHLMERSYKIRRLNLAIIGLFITNGYLQGLLAYNSMFVFVVVLLFISKVLKHIQK